MRKSYKPWVILLILPWIIWPLIIGSSIATRNIGRCESSALTNGLQPGARLDTASTDVSPSIDESCTKTSPVKTVINIVNLLLGIFAAIGILGYPLWIILLVHAQEHNRKLSLAAPAAPVTPLDPQQPPLPPQQPLPPQYPPEQPPAPPTFPQ